MLKLVWTMSMALNMEWTLLTLVQIKNKKTEDYIAQKHLPMRSPSYLAFHIRLGRKKEISQGL